MLFELVLAFSRPRYEIYPGNLLFFFRTWFRPLNMVSPVQQCSPFLWTCQEKWKSTVLELSVPFIFLKLLLLVPSLSKTFITSHPLKSGVLFKMHVIFVMLQWKRFANFESENISGYNLVKCSAVFIKNVVLGKEFTVYRCSHRSCPVKKCVLQNFANFTESCVGVSFW